MTAKDRIEALLAFWFGDALVSVSAARARVPVWFAGKGDFDGLCRDDFADLPERAQAGELDSAAVTPRGSLALVISLDQLPRNLYRGNDRAFAFDALALGVARDAVAAGRDERLHPLEAMFLYLPFEHAEDLSAQDRSVALFEGLALRAPAGLETEFEGFVDYATRHRELIRRFGRFPHRNEVLGRSHRGDERSYLAEGGETFGNP